MRLNWLERVKLRYPDVTPDKHERNTYWVASRVKRSKLGPYKVVLDDYEWSGFCSCHDFEFNDKWGPLERGADGGDEFRCHHIKRARAFHLDLIGPMVERIIQLNLTEQFERALHDDKHETKNEQPKQLTEPQPGQRQKKDYYPREAPMAPRKPIRLGRVSEKH